MHRSKLLPNQLSPNSNHYELKLMVGRLLSEGCKDRENQRSQQREPFFKVVSLSFPGDDRRFSCFSRDISPTGIGLLHIQPLDPGDVIITVYSDTLGPIRIACEIVWCDAVGEGWHASGLRFRNALGA